MRQVRSASSKAGRQRQPSRPLPLSDERLARDLLDATFAALALTRLTPARLKAIANRSIEAAHQNARESQRQDPGAEPGTYARALANWYRDSAYLDSDGSPASLPIAGPRPSVHALLRSVGLRRGIESATERLIRSGAIVLQSDGRALPVSRAMVYAREPDLALRHFVEGVQRFVQTVQFNTSLQGLQAPLFEQSAIVRNLPAEDVESFRQFVAGVGFSTVNTIDDWLESRVTAASRRKRRGQVQSAGVYMFAFAETPQPDGAAKSQPLGSSSRSARRRILPTLVLGNSSRK